MMTPAELREARKRLGLSTGGLAKIIEVEGGTVRKWEAPPDSDRHRPIPGPVRVLMHALLTNAAVRRYFRLTLR